MMQVELGRNQRLPFGLPDRLQRPLPYNTHEMRVPRLTEPLQDEEQQQQQLFIPKLDSEFWTLQRQMRTDHLQILLQIQKELHESPAADFQVMTRTHTGTHLVYVHAGLP